MFNRQSIAGFFVITSC